jgi:hypothetical protein
VIAINHQDEELIEAGIAEPEISPEGPLQRAKRALFSHFPSLGAALVR